MVPFPLTVLCYPSLLVIALGKSPRQQLMNGRFCWSANIVGAHKRTLLMSESSEESSVV